MITKHYESVVIINAALEDDQVETTLSRIQEAIKTNGGEITDLEKWGRKRLAYPIQKSKSGYYAVYRYTATTDIVAKVERIFNLDETIIRFLTIALDKKALEYLQKQKEDAAKRAEEVSDTSVTDKTE
ncbi:MAG: 30S ribosomal protein S6 [Melioribacteraceae bacterium]|nr:30S ribosomal protein S6 [Melioribacteraceae bacterium]MCF8354952.1 30S ribosomal protein S6 [Melioribacteraceae bacterium]MCF8392359.1 30S ribosomal protein S6 [Melioribacteraceae bacterium]MCF8417879.1 30S ribosomal protein S6 [Melioribacteraceae bacterium]